MLRSNMLHAVAVLLITPEGIPLVKDPLKPPPLFWKLPGGRGPASETAAQAAIREVNEEIGVSLAEKDLEVIYREDRDTHILTIFKASLVSLPKLKKIGNDEEKVGVFSAQQILSMPDFFPNHLKIIKQELELLGLQNSTG